MVKSKSTNEADDAQPFFNEQVAFPSLESIILYGLRNTKIIWHNQLPQGSFCKLKELDVRDCENLMTIFTKDMVGSIFKSIEKLAIYSCASVEEVFKVGEINLKEPVQTPLRNLRINSLPSLKHVWNEDPRGILTFHNMESVIVCDCPSIKNVFPVSIAQGLKQLQKLQIEGCGVEEIVAMGCEGTEAALKFVFPQLSNIRLTRLQRLRYFYPRKHITLWPELKNLNVFDCGCADEVEIRNGQGRPDFPVGQPLFSMEEV
ncbi:hypothetical protein SLEP1_g50649 [Rubroshorea leprosula]|uniref:Disease resistance protein At4g27190-like leucine-rich repeats domain-containing protein n=1 Tax=Rubroshorea leprosula TaxID=152421 RepID=A0AAV5M397_9ROSI|nr:hypothetical protein SLEP1_g50649 [Rubroshorea leprosula]